MQADSIRKQMESVLGSLDKSKQQVFENGVAAIQGILKHRKIIVIHHPCGYGKLSYVGIFKPLCRLTSTNEFHNDTIRARTTYILLIVPMKAINIGHSQSYIFRQMDISFVVWTDRLSNDIGNVDVVMICPETLRSQSFQSFFNGGSHCVLVIVDELMTVFIQASFRPALQSFIRLLYGKVPIVCLSGSICHSLRKPQHFHSMFRLDQYISNSNILQFDENSPVIQAGKPFDIDVYTFEQPNQKFEVLSIAVKNICSNFIANEDDTNTKKIMVFANTHDTAIKMHHILKQSFPKQQQVGIIFSGKLDDWDTFCNNADMQILITTSVASYGVSPPKCDMVIIIHSHSVDQLWQSINRSGRFAGSCVPKIRILYCKQVFESDYGSYFSPKRKSGDQHQINSLLSTSLLSADEFSNLFSIYTASSFQMFCTSKKCRMVYLASLFHPSITVPECRRCDVCISKMDETLSECKEVAKEESKKTAHMDQEIVQTNSSIEYIQMEEQDQSSCVAELAEYYECIWNNIYRDIKLYCFFCKRKECKDNTFNGSKHFLCAERVKRESKYFSNVYHMLQNTRIIDGMIEVDTTNNKLCLICMSVTREHGQSTCKSMDHHFTNQSNQDEALQICFACYKPNVLQQVHHCIASKDRVLKQRFHALFRYVFICQEMDGKKSGTYEEMSSAFRRFYANTRTNSAAQVLDNAWIANVCESHNLLGKCN